MTNRLERRKHALNSRILRPRTPPLAPALILLKSAFGGEIKPLQSVSSFVPPPLRRGLDALSKFYCLLYASLPSEVYVEGKYTFTVAVF